MSTETFSKHVSVLGDNKIIDHVLVVLRLDNTIHWINHHPVDKC